MGNNQKWEAFEAGKKKYTPIKWWWQRVTRGFDDREVWDLNKAIVKFIAPRLDYFTQWEVEHGMRYPDDLDPAAWTAALKKMAQSFNILEKLGGSMWMESEEETVLEGLELFGKYLLDLTD